MRGSFAATLAFTALTAVLAGCQTVDFSSPLAGQCTKAGVAVKNFIVLGDVSVKSTETHTVSPFGIVRKVEGAKITYSDLMLEAAALDADDIITVRIEMNTNGKTTFMDWLKGWKRIFTYTGAALAVKYIDGNDEPDAPVGFFLR